MSFDRVMGTLAVLVAAFLIVPTLLIIPMSWGTDGYLRFPPRGFTLDWYAAFFSDRDWTRAALFSLRIGVLTTLVSVAVGTAVALAMARSRMPFLRTVQTLMVTPLVLPQVVVAIALLLYYQKLELIGSTLAFVASHACLALPYVVFTVGAALRRYDADLDAAALVCGASRWTIFRRITLPLLKPALLSSALFAFLISFDEAVISFFLSGVSDKALARKFFEDVELNVTPVLAAVATMLTLLTALVLAVGLSLRRKTPA